MTYPTDAQYARWKDRANEFDMTVSEFMQGMIEAGMKKFDATVEPDETTRELRAQRNDLKGELDHARSRIDRLEDRLHRNEYTTVHEYIEENPGATFDEIVQRVIDTVPSRVNTHLTDLEGDHICIEDGRYFPADGGEEGAL
jgi:hypothetical protein